VSVRRVAAVAAAFAVTGLGLGPAVPASAGPTPSATSATSATSADLRADVDRDGTVDVVGSSDEAGETSWTLRRGAVMLPNIDDDTERCAPEINLCNDATDDVVNGGADVDDLARLRTVPIPGAPAGSSATVKTIGARSDQARLFLERGGAWITIRPGTELTTAEVRAGVELGIEGVDVIRDARVWDGRITVRLTVEQHSLTTTDDVVLRVAPVLTHSPVQPVEQVLVTGGSGFGAQDQFVDDLGELVEAAGITTPLIELPDGDIWTQDFFEPAYTSITGADGEPQVLRVMIRSAQTRFAGQQVFSVLRGPDVGAIELSGVTSWETLNSMGNLETIPPYEHKGQVFPAGRIIQGERDGTEPAAAMRTLLRSQGLQKPMLLDTSWLYVGHVDEFVQFLPAGTERGWKIAVSDPAGGLDLLRDAVGDGHGSTRLFSQPGGPSTTIAQALANPTFLADNALAADRIAGNLRELRRKTGVKGSEVVRVPGLYSQSPSGLLAKLGSVSPRNPALADRVLGQPLEGGGVQTAAEIPGAINGIVISPDTYIAPKQWGPVIGGEDIFRAAVDDAYAEVGMDVVYLDDWYSHHVGFGEVHCGTNTYRDATARWWPGG